MIKSQTNQTLNSMQLNLTANLTAEPNLGVAFESFQTTSYLKQRSNQKQRIFDF